MNLFKALLLFAWFALGLAARADISADRALIAIDDWSQWGAVVGAAPSRKAQLIFFDRGTIVGRVPLLVEGLTAGAQLEIPATAHQQLTAYHVFDLGSGTTVDAILGTYFGLQAGVELAGPDAVSDGVRGALAVNSRGVTLGIAHRLTGFGVSVAFNLLSIKIDPEFPEASLLLHERIDWHPATAGKKVDVANDRQTTYVQCNFEQPPGGEKQFIVVSAGGLWKRGIGSYSSFTGTFGYYQEAADLRLVPADPARPRRYVFENAGSRQGPLSFRLVVEPPTGSLFFALKTGKTVNVPAFACKVSDKIDGLDKILAGP